ncbi:SDR family oxidoreductase [Halobacillus salinarum]|uniref:SDR family oxidoreductase n=1 Tax=Halobacillus salinarum TaxID=2932257 RepID=A0ABY4ELV2_9BACI|nr:SDR family oxidoreductase [Halobacillus salinarum]UOQ45427.1 SDR family oxidoreductase [Halobacillus salinarum]
MARKVVVVTGATRGIGRNTALYFAKKDYTVIGTGRDEAKLDELQTELSEFSIENKAWKLDVTKPESSQQVVQEVADAFGRIDVWVNNAGSFKAIGPTWEVDAENWVTDVTTNLIGTFYCVQAIVPQLLKQGSGRIVNIVGGGTFSAFPYGNGYGTSKTAIARLTENLAAELADTDVKAFALDPGLNDTDMTRYQRDTDIGQKYLPKIEELFEEGVDVPPERAPMFVHAFGEGRLDEFEGRIVTVNEELKEYEKESSLEESDFKLRYMKK